MSGLDPPKNAYLTLETPNRKHSKYSILNFFSYVTSICCEKKSLILVVNLDLNFIAHYRKAQPGQSILIRNGLDFGSIL